MTDMAVQQTLQRIADEAAKEQVQAPEAPGADDAARFRQALAGPPGADPSAGAPPVEAAGQAAEIGPADRTVTPGDAILRGIDQVRSGFNEGLQRIHETLAQSGTDGLTTAEMMQIQMDISRITLQEELTGKVASKGTQSVDTLLKNQ